MNSESGKHEFNPSGIGLKNGNFIGLPYDETTAKIILIPVPWDVTVSFGEGTALGSSAIREASVQLDLFDTDVKDAWKLGIYMMPVPGELLQLREVLRPKAAQYIDFLEGGGIVSGNPEMEQILNEVNEGCNTMNEWVYEQSAKMLKSGRVAAVIGGDHSVPLGLLRAVAERYENFGMLHIDAHHDLRDSYEGFRWSHASILHNVLKNIPVTKLVQVAIRDYCDEEVLAVEHENSRVSVFYDQLLKDNKYNGMSWHRQCDKIVELLPRDVYITLDMDGFDPKLCPNTGTPVPGGLEFNEVTYLFRRLVDTGHRIIGFDVCETGNHAWDANVAARAVYKLSNLTGKSQGLI